MVFIFKSLASRKKRGSYREVFTAVLKIKAILKVDLYYQH